MLVCHSETNFLSINYSCSRIKVSEWIAQKIRTFLTWYFSPPAGQAVSVICSSNLPRKLNSAKTSKGLFGSLFCFSPYYCSSYKKLLWYFHITNSDQRHKIQNSGVSDYQTPQVPNYDFHQMGNGHLNSEPSFNASHTSHNGKIFGFVFWGCSCIIGNAHWVAWECSVIDAITQ